MEHENTQLHVKQMALRSNANKGGKLIKTNTNFLHCAVAICSEIKLYSRCSKVQHCLCVFNMINKHFNILCTEEQNGP